MPTREEGKLTLGEIVAYAGTETDWHTRVAIRQTSPIQRLESEDSVFRCRIFDSIREAIHWARENHYDGVTLPVTVLMPQPR